jgi:hypothetical protein
MPPEQARGALDDLDERADVYGLGAILLTLLANHERPIGPGMTASTALAGLAAIAPPLRSICARALAESPADRYPSATALGDDVARYRAGQAVQAHRETAFERAARIAKVYQAPILLVLAYMVMRAFVALATGH